MKYPNQKTIDKMEQVLNIASDSTRIKILFSLMLDEESNEVVIDYDSNQSTKRVEKSVSQIVKDTGASQSLVSHQLKILRDSRLVDFHKEGKNVYYFLLDDHVYKLLQVVYEHVCEGKKL